MPTFSFTPIDFNTAIDILAPGRAASSFQGVFGVDSGQTNIPDPNVQNYGYDDYQRFDWSLLQPNSAGVYNWTPFDNAVKKAIERGQKFSFGIVPVDNFSGNGAISVGGGFIGYPMFVHTAMQAETTKDWLCSASSTWVPNWNSESYLSAVEAFLIALNSHIQTTTYTFNSVTYNFRDVIYIIDIRLFGNYGEWHTFGICRGSEPTGTKATAPTLRRIIDAHCTAFPSYPLVGNVNMFNTEIPDDTAYYILTKTNTWGKLGWRSDHLGDTATYTYDLNQMNKTVNGLNISTEALSRWKTAPITGEPMNDATRVSAGGSSPYWQFETEIRNFGLVQFSNHNNVVTSNAQANTNIRNGSKASGYRLILTGGSVTTGITPGATFAVTLQWQNTGVSPSYENWNTTFELRTLGDVLVTSWASSFNARLFLPNTAASIVTDNLVMPGNVAAGTYKLNLIIKDPNGFRQPLPLAITSPSRNSDGSYTLSASVTVGAATTTTSTTTTSTTSTTTTSTSTTSTTSTSTSTTTKPPLTITSFNVVQSGADNLATWSVANGPATVTLERSPNNLTFTTIFTGTESSTTFTDINPNATYYYRLRAVGATSTVLSNTILITRTPTTTTTTSTSTTTQPTTTTSTSTTTQPTTTTSTSTTTNTTTTTSTSTTTAHTTTTSSTTSTSTTTRPPTTTTSTSTTTRPPTTSTTSTSTTTSSPLPGITFSFTSNFYVRNRIYLVVTSSAAFVGLIRIYDSAGTLVFSRTYNIRNGITNISISTSTLRKGNYSIYLTQNGKTQFFGRNFTRV